MSSARILVVSLALLAPPLLRAADGGGTADTGGLAGTLHAGDPVENVLIALNARGHRVVYSSALVSPDMKLAAVPRARDIGRLLAEVLAPFGLRAVRAANGDWLVVAESATPPRAEPPPIADTIETIDVTASRFGLASQATGASGAFLDRQAVESMPHLGDDAVRMLKILPGVSGGDFSAALNIRGGRRDETLLMIDGAEIHNGFHFRDLTGALSVVDTHLVESIDFTTGGMTARWGDYMSGVVDMRTRRPLAADDYRSVVGVSFVSVYGRTGATFADERGSWLVAARRGYLDVLMEQVTDESETITPRYSDLFAALDYDIGERTRLSGRMLLGADDLKFITRDADDNVDSAGKGESAHAWLTLDHGFGEALRVSTTLSSSRLHLTRDSAGEEENERFGDVDADFRFEFADLRQDWSWTLGERNLLSFGANAGWTGADYEYRLEGGIYDPRIPGGIDFISRAADLEPSGTKYGLHAAWRTSPADALTTELGVRRDSYRYPGGVEYGVTSPRVNVVWSLGGKDEVRAAWGVVHQPQGIDALQVEDGVSQFFEPERAQHAVLGYSRRLRENVSARVDVYRKSYSHLHPRFENSLDQMQLIPEGAVDRVRIDASEAEASGIELTLRREAERGYSGWISLAFARARDRDPDGGWTSRLWEQTRTLSFGASFTGVKWNLSLAGIFHDGIPSTRLESRRLNVPGQGEVLWFVQGPRNGTRLRNYERMDLRVNRDVSTRTGRMSFYLEVTNLFDRKNPCCIEGAHEQSSGGAPYLVFDESNWLPMLPSFGIQYEF
jgi:outer membrane cobalamin receptor